MQSGAAAMPSNDVRTLLHTAVPTAAVGMVAVVISAVVGGGHGALGAAVGLALTLAFMGGGMVALQRTAKHLPQLFQAMGLLLYVVQLLLLFVFLAVFKGTELFDFKAFAFTLLASTIAWIAAQARAYMKVKILYVDPASAEAEKPQKTGSSS
jgi:ATP synthase protein I